MEITINDKLYKQIKDYCLINELDIVEYVNELLKKEFMIDKYGDKPSVSKLKKKEDPIKINKETGELTIKDNALPIEGNYEIPQKQTIVTITEENNEPTVQEIKPKKRKLK